MSIPIVAKPSADRTIQIGGWCGMKINWTYLAIKQHNSNRTILVNIDVENSGEFPTVHFELDDSSMAWTRGVRG
jgi:hypothetical protein